MNWLSENEKRDVLKYQNELIREIEQLNSVNFALRSENDQLYKIINELNSDVVKANKRISELEDEQKTERAKILNEHYRDKEKLYSKLLHYEDRDKIINGVMELVDQAIGAQRFEWTIAENQMALVPTSDVWTDELLNKIDDLFEPYTNGYRNYN
jgi:predicted nuclease with TOPRIM domain